MSKTELTTLKQAVAIRSEHVCSQRTTLRVRQHCLSWSFGDFSVTDDAEAGSSTKQPQLFTVDGKVGSWSQRRAVRDASGLPIFDMRRKTSGATWYAELPGGSDKPLVTLAPRRNDLKDRLDVYVHGEKNEYKLEVRGLDIWKKATHVYLNGSLVMDIKLVNLLSVYVPFVKDNQWDVRVCEGMDASLVPVIMVVLAANMYDSSLLVTGSSAGAATGAAVGAAAGGGAGAGGGGC